MSPPIGERWLWPALGNTTQEFRALCKRMKITSHANSKGSSQVSVNPITDCALVCWKKCLHSLAIDMIWLQVPYHIYTYSDMENSQSNHIGCYHQVLLSMSHDPSAHCLSLPTSRSPCWGQWPGTDDIDGLRLIYQCFKGKPPTMCKSPGRLSFTSGWWCSSLKTHPSAGAILPNKHKRRWCSIALNRPRHATPQAMVMGQYFRAFGER